MLQAEGVITIGATDYSDETISFEIVRRRNLTTKPATFGNIREVQSAGSLVEEVRITAFTSVVATSLSDELYAAVDTDSSELAFTAKFVDAAISANNAEYQGTFVVTGATVGGRVNQWNQQTWTFPITAAGITKDTTP